MLSETGVGALGVFGVPLQEVLRQTNRENSIPEVVEVLLRVMYERNGTIHRVLYDI